MENSNELKQLQEQFNILNRRLSEQEIVDENFIRSSISKNVRSINSDGRKMTILAAVGIVAIVADHYLVHWSWCFTIVTCVFMFIAIYFNYYTRRGLNDASALSSDLVDMRLKALRLRKLQTRWLWFGIPFIIVWLTWLAYETVNIYSDPKALLIGALVGGVIGAIIGFRQYLRTQRQALEIINDIESLKQK
ncbi:MAG: hypothetical protein ACI308_00715 [Muribaculaceae bacterium]